MLLIKLIILFCLMTISISSTNIFMTDKVDCNYGRNSWFNLECWSLNEVPGSDDIAIIRDAHVFVKTNISYYEVNTIYIENAELNINNYDNNIFNVTNTIYIIGRYDFH